jgi:hypothetical protein
MLPKIVGYGGFQSYSELPYPKLKPGKEVLAPNDIWERSTFMHNNQSRKTSGLIITL